MLIAFFTWNVLREPWPADSIAFGAHRNGRNPSPRGCRHRLRPHGLPTSKTSTAESSIVADRGSLTTRQELAALLERRTIPGFKRHHAPPSGPSPLQEFPASAT